MINNTALELIKYYEGFSSNVYLCPAGFKTIGFGHKLPKHSNITHISKENAEELLKKDIELVNMHLVRLLKVPISFFQEAALLSFIYNLGIAAFQRSSLRQKLNREDYFAAADEFPKWVYCNKKKLRGLLQRRLAERELFLNF